jgi:hypothetical protein
MLSALMLSALTIGLFALTIGLSALLLTGCSGASGGSSGSDASSSSGSTSWSATIDGRPASGNAPTRASLVSLDQDKNLNGIAFQLTRLSDKIQTFDFLINKSGNTPLPSADLRTVSNYYVAKGVVYIADSAIVTITSESSDRVTGTFSGRFKYVDYGAPLPANLSETIEIANGKFDAPF